MEKKSTKTRGRVVYRPLAIRKRRLVEIEKYYPGLNYKAYIREARYYLGSGRYLTFDRVVDRHFFYEYQYDVTERRSLHAHTKFDYNKYVNLKWMSVEVRYTYESKRRRKKQSLCSALYDMLIKDLLDDMLDNNNKLIFPVMNTNKHPRTLGWLKLGFFREQYYKKIGERLILALVPHKREAVGNYYPVIRQRCVYNMISRRKNLNLERYECIDIQERIAADQRSNGLGRRFYSPGKTKAYNLSRCHRLPSRSSSTY